MNDVICLCGLIQFSHLNGCIGIRDLKTLQSDVTVLKTNLGCPLFIGKIIIVVIGTSNKCKIITTKVLRTACPKLCKKPRIRF